MKPIVVSLLFVMSALSACTSSTTEWAENTPGNLPDQYRICVLGDAGTGKAEQYQVKDALLHEGCDELRMVGDVIYENGITSADDPQLYDKFLTPYADLLSDRPFYIAMGNHDHKADDTAWIDVAQTHENVIFPSQYYATRRGDLCFITLDTEASYLAQVRWVHNLEPAMSDCALRIAFGHHPYFSSGHHGDANPGMKLFLRTTVMGDTDLYIAGHDHQLSDEGQLENTRLLISGAAGKLRNLKEVPRVWGVSQLGYLVLIVHRDPDLLEYQFKTVEEDGLASIAFHDTMDFQR
ncbi:metallophosphoesterase [Saccharospirillum mangrovi]|uniref:metallophosphoesterase n=1 Tax=Saccharospirillum mangrovi TaxID=2161747 RepID=UPI00130033D4|nr:metallophosphoesterase [Saccharospirillum mangrovi]